MGGVVVVSERHRQIAQRIFYYVLIHGGKSNPFQAIRSDWFVDIAAVHVAEMEQERMLQTPATRASDAPAEPSVKDAVQVMVESLGPAGLLSSPVATIVEDRGLPTLCLELCRCRWPKRVTRNGIEICTKCNRAIGERERKP